jgi:hypothetical protein
LVEEVYDFGREAASLSAILTSSANDRACVFRITGPRWTFTALLSPSNLLAGAIGRDHHHHLALTWRQRIELGTLPASPQRDSARRVRCMARAASRGLLLPSCASLLGQILPTLTLVH